MPTYLMSLFWSIVLVRFPQVLESPKIFFSFSRPGISSVNFLRCLIFDYVKMCYCTEKELVFVAVEQLKTKKRS